MKIKNFITDFERRSFISRAILEKRGDFTGLNCAGKWTERFGMPKRVSEFMKNFDWVTMSQRGDIKGLKEEICRFWSEYANLKTVNIKLGAGSMRVLQYVNQLFIDKGSVVLGYAPQFFGYPLAVTSVGAAYRVVLLDPDDNYKLNIPGLIDAITDEYSTIYIDNPNNPTGQVIALQDLESVVKKAKSLDVAVIVDEAYGDSMDMSNSAINLCDLYDNVIVTRTFTKGYQFSRIKVGYGIMSEELGYYYDKIDFPQSVIGVDASIAKEALLDKEFIPYMNGSVKKSKQELIEGLRARDYQVAETSDRCEIFVMAHKDKQMDLWSYLLDRDILTIPSTDFYASPNFGSNAVRVTTPLQAGEFLGRL